VCGLGVSTEPTGLKGLFNNTLPQKALDRACLISVILLSALLVLLAYDKLAPVSEGWYVVYADLILAGKTPYVDFELVFPPVYTYMMTAVTLVFGDSLLAFRLIGVLLFIGTAVLSYFIIKLISPSWVAAVASIVTVFMLQSDAIFVSYDYIIFFNLINCLAFYILFRLIVRSYRKEPVNVNLNMFLAGIMCGLAILFRQSSGAMIFAYFLVFLIMAAILMKGLGLRHRNLLYILAGATLPILITAVLLILAGAFTPFMDMVLFSGTKGNMAAILFGWVALMFMENYAGVAVGVAAALCFLVIFRWRTDDAPDTGGKADHLMFFAFAASMAAVTVILFASLGLSSFAAQFLALDFTVTAAYVFVFILFMVLLFKTVNKIRKGEHISELEITYLFFTGFFVVVGWGAGTSVNITLRHFSLCFGFAAAILLIRISRTQRIKNKFILKAAALFTVFMFLAVPLAGKVVTSYDWLGIKTEPYNHANYVTDIEYFKGIRLTANEKFLYEDFVDNANTYLGDGDELYCYSQIPIFYALADKLPTVRSPVPWFDVASDRTVLEDLEYLKGNNPKMIVFADHGYRIMEVQEKYYRGGAESGQRAVYEWLLECRDGASSVYTVIQGYSIEDYMIYTMVLDPMKVIEPWSPAP